MDADVQGSIEIALVCTGGADTPPETFADMLTTLSSVDGSSKGGARAVLGPPRAEDFPEGSASAELRGLWEGAIAQLEAVKGKAGCGVGAKLPLFLQFLMKRHHFKCVCPDRLRTNAREEA